MTDKIVTLVTKKKPPKEKEPEWPKVCCGVCEYSHMIGEDLVCYVMPPQAVDSEDGIVAIRGTAVEPRDLPCYVFKPKLMA